MTDQCMTELARYATAPAVPHNRQDQCAIGTYDDVLDAQRGAATDDVKAELLRLMGLAPRPWATQRTWTTKRGARSR